MIERARKRLSKRAKKGFRGWPVATVALYGPDDTTATKLTVGIVPAKDAEATDLRRWFSEEQTDIRVTEEVLAFIRAQRLGPVERGGWLSRRRLLPGYICRQGAPFVRARENGPRGDSSRGALAAAIAGMGRRRTPVLRGRHSRSMVCGDNGFRSWI
jgi:hypothetical protein